MQLILTALLLSSALLCFADNQDLKGVLKKCCRSGQQLEWVGEDFDCVDFDLNDTKINENAWISREEFQFDSATISFSDIVTVEDSMPDCKSKDYLYHGRYDLIVRGDVIFVSVNNSETNSFTYPSSEFCVDKYYDPEDTDIEYMLLLCPCNARHCVQKCCSMNMDFDLDVDAPGCVKPNGTMRDWLPRPDENAESMYLLYEKYPTCGDAHTVPALFNRIGNKSQLQFFSGNLMKALDDQDIEFTSMEEYCVDNSLNADVQVVLHCVTSESMMYQAYGWLFIIGAVALLLTILLTILLPVMRKNVFGKMAFCHNISLFFGSLFSGVASVMQGMMQPTSCVIFSIIIQFSFLATFFWLNVMCIDMSLVFGSMTPVKMGPQRDRKKFIYASVYAWGCSTLITLITLIVEFISPVGTRFKPNFGAANCFFNDRSSQFLFFYGPMTILLVINIVLFIFTIIKIITVHQSTAILNNSDSKSSNARNRQMLILYVKLFFLMGATWLSEVISWAVEDGLSEGGKTWVFITDIINLLRGVFIFIIFCCRTAVVKGVRNKINGTTELSRQATWQSGSTRSCASQLEFNELGGSKKGRSYSISSISSNPN